MKIELKLCLLLDWMKQFWWGCSQSSLQLNIQYKKQLINVENDEESTDTASNGDDTGCGSESDGKAEYDENQNNDNSNDKMTNKCQMMK